MNEAMISLGRTSAGDFDAADALLDDARDRLARQPWIEAFGLYVVALTSRLHAGGDAASQEKALQELETTFGAEMVALAEPMLPVKGIYRVPLSIWAGRIDEAEAILERLGSDPGRLPWVDGARLWLNGLIAERRQQPGRARRFFDDALNGGIAGMPLLYAHALADRARIDGDPVAVARAIDAYRDLGQVPYLDRLTRETVGPETGAVRPARSVVMESLSDRERDVVALVTSGLSYAQIAQDLFISRSTVSFHLGKIYAKTGTTSRHDLTALIRSGVA